jgi:hypothetical protein
LGSAQYTDSTGKVKVGGPLLDADPFKEGQNLSPDASNESVSEKARVFILKNRKKTVVEDRVSGNKNTHDGEISAVTPPRPPVPNAIHLCQSRFLMLVKNAMTN